MIFNSSKKESQDTLIKNFIKDDSMNKNPIVIMILII